MARRRNLKSLGTPILLAAISVPLGVALLVGWTLLLAKNLTSAQGTVVDVWLLVVGLVSFVVILFILVMFAIFLGREILEVRRQDSFIDSVTHELKSPLASLKLCLQTLARKEVSEAHREQLRRMMLEDVDRLSSFIDDVLQASRLAHDTQSISLSDVSLRDLADQCVAQVRSRHHVPSASIHVDVAPELVVITDRAALEIVLKNLVDNAVKYSDDAVDVLVTGHLDSDGTATLEVRDRGIGIPRKQLKRVFHRFYRVQEEDVRKRRGTGLGLFVVSALVRNMGGRVEAVANGDGAGTTMRVVIPSGGQASDDVASVEVAGA